MKQSYPYLILLALALLIYGNTVNHGFVLDDEVVISKNAFVQDGISGISKIFSNDSFAGHERVGEGKQVLTGGRYRPLSLALFAVIYEFAGWKPMPFHVAAILLYAALVIMLFSWLRYMLRDQPQGKLVALIAAALFAVHPIHTEVVANIKSCDETLALLFGAASMYSMLKAFDLRSKNWIVISCLSMLMACLAKESAVTLVLAGPLSLWFFRKASFRQVIGYGLPVAVGAIVYIIIRTMILSDTTAMEMAADPLNNPFLKWSPDQWVPFSMTERIATIAFVSWKYLQLLMFPYPLTHDYYPFVIEARSFASVFDWLGALAMLGLLVGGLWCLRKRTAIGYSILFYLLTISVALNIFFPIGTFMAERFLFTPSVGFCLGVVMLAMLWKHQFTKNKYAIAVPAAVIIALLAVMTVVRNGDWKDNITLHESALQTSAKSAKLQNDYGTIKLSEALSKTDSVERKALFDTAFIHLEKAVKLHQTYYDAMLAFGAASYYKGEFEYSVFAYQRAFSLAPDDTKSGMGLYYALQGYAFDQAGKKNYDKAIEALKQAQEMSPDTILAKRILEYEGLRAK